MTIYEMANNILSKEDREELHRAIFLLNNNSEEFYKTYSNLIQNIIFVTSQNEFIDFLNKDSLNKNIFILEFLCSKNYCIRIGEYEKNIDNKIINFLNRNKIKLTNTVNIDMDIEDNDNFKNYLFMLNNELNHIDFGICVLFDDIYYAGVYTLFIYNRKFNTEIFQKLEDNDISIYFN